MNDIDRVILEFVGECYHDWESTSMLFKCSKCDRTFYGSIQTLPQVEVDYNFMFEVVLPGLEKQGYDIVIRTGLMKDWLVGFRHVDYSGLDNKGTHVSNKHDLLAALKAAVVTVIKEGKYV